MTELRYPVLFDPAEEGGFVATCPALPGLVTEGDTLHIQTLSLSPSPFAGFLGRKES